MAGFLYRYWGRVIAEACRKRREIKSFNGSESEQDLFRIGISEAAERGANGRATRNGWRKCTFSGAISSMKLEKRDKIPILVFLTGCENGVASERWIEGWGLTHRAKAPTDASPIRQALQPFIGPGLTCWQAGFPASSDDGPTQWIFPSRSCFSSRSINSCRKCPSFRVASQR